MQELGERRDHPELRDLVVEASRALACLDADRLEELALSCQALNRDLAPASAVERAGLARQAREAAGDMAVFARVIEVTQANLQVINRLRELRADRLEYGAPSGYGGGRRTGMGTISSAFSMLSGALDADQSALTVVANNVAGANTPGYTEETPHLEREPRQSLSMESRMERGLQRPARRR